MADIAPTQAVVVEGSIQTIQLGEAVTVVGQLLRRDASTNKYVLADAGATIENSIVAYMALELGILDDLITVLRPNGVVDLGTVLTPALDYALSATSGAIAPYTDLVSTNYASFVGIARTTSELQFSVINSRTTKP